MTFHLAAYQKNADLAGADTPLDAVLDQALNTEDTFVRVPPALTNLIGEAAGAAVTTLTLAYVRSPSLRVLSNQAIATLNGSVALADQDYQLHPLNPRGLAAQEGVEVVLNTDDAAAQEHLAGLWLADGALSPTSGNMFTTRATAAITTTAGTWTLGDMGFDDRLPIGRYQVVGMRALNAGGGFARLVFPGMPWRPGVPAATAVSDSERGDFRFGRLSIWGEFDLNQPPQLEVIGGTGTAQVVFLDMIRAG